MAITGLFQSTPPRGKRPVSRQRADRPEVSIHAPAREATCRHPRRSTLCGTCRFNPRPRAGSDVQRAPLGLSYDVSIHAPAREATPGRLVLIHGGLEVSIHAPAREATHPTLKTKFLKLAFQSTPPRGKRPGCSGGASLGPEQFQSTPPRGKRHVGDDRVHDLCVSIHAPAREATPRPSCRAGRPVFQSTPPRGKRLRALAQRLARVIVLFQSTPPRGKRPTGIPSCRPASCFNPRPRAGSDLVELIVAVP